MSTQLFPSHAGADEVPVAFSVGSSSWAAAPAAAMGLSRRPLRLMCSRLAESQPVRRHLARESMGARTWSVSTLSLYLSLYEASSVLQQGMLRVQITQWSKRLALQGPASSLTAQLRGVKPQGLNPGNDAHDGRWRPDPAPALHGCKAGAMGCN